MTDARTTALARMAAHVLTHGLAEATLRPLARAAGTSDRMLIYHFGSKDRLLAEILDHLAGRLTALLEAAPLPPAETTEALAPALLALMRSPEAGPFVQVWLELAARAARGDAACREIGGRILDHFHTWIARRLPPGANAAALLVQIEGTLLVEAMGAAGLSLTAAAGP